MKEIEKYKLVEFIEFYRNHHDKISNIESEIMKLKNNADLLLSELQEKRQEEELFINKLSLIYTDDEIRSSLSELKIH